MKVEPIRDETYFEMSKRSYIQNIRTEHEFTYKDKIEKWEVVSPRKVDKNTGFNATVFKNGENIVVTYRDIR